MIQPWQWRWSRRGLMYLIIGLQLVILAAIVASQEINRLLDSSFAVELEITQTHAQKDPFRGASISGRPALDLESAKAIRSPRQFEPGDKVLVFFSAEPDGRPRVKQIELQGWGKDLPFSKERFSIPGTVRKKTADRSFFPAQRVMVVLVGKPAVAVELDLPASIPIDTSALEQLSRPSMVRASLRQGFLGHRYFDNIRLTGQAWTDEMTFSYDAIRDRLVVFAPEGLSFERMRQADDQPLHTRLFFFDGTGKELNAVEVAGRLVYGEAHPTDGTFWALLATERWGHATVQLAKVGEKGVILQRGPQVGYDRIVGFDAEEGSLWVLAGPSNPAPGTAHFVERMTFGALQAPRLGPFASKPRSVITQGKKIWVVEANQHRVTRFDRTGRVEKEYRDLNRPTNIAIDAGSLFVVEAAQTQLSRFSMEGQALWRTPRFQGISWILPEPETGGGWVGAQGFEGQARGVFRYNPDGKVSHAATAGALQTTRGVWARPDLAPDSIRSRTNGRLYIREDRTIVILTPDGAVLKRVEGFRYATEQRVRS